MSKNARIFVASPFRWDEQRNRKYAVACMMDCLRRGESPFAPHLLYPIFLDDNHPEDRARGIQAGLDWMLKADIVAFYIDLGMSEGMREEMKFAKEHKIKFEERNLARHILEAI